MRCKIIHCIKRNDWCYAILRNIDTKEKYNCTGFKLPTNTALIYEVELEPYQHPTYGHQYKIISCSELIDSTEECLVTYLCSGAIKGIGPKLARRIYDFYGENTLKILDEDISRLVEVQGISSKKLVEIQNSWEITRKSKELAMLLLPHRFSQNIIRRIYSLYKEKSIEIAEQNPYLLCNIHGVSYSMADGLNQQNDNMSEERIYAAAKEVLIKNYIDGKIGIEKNVLIQKMMRLIHHPNFNLNNAWTYVYKQIQVKALSYRKVKINHSILFYLYLPAIEQMERKLATLIVERIEPIDLQKSEAELVEIVKHCAPHISPDDTQIQAVCTCLQNRFTYFTGEPGSGKTTTISVLEKAYHSLFPKRKVYFLSPSNKAARRMTECTGQEAESIHSFFSIRVQNDIEFLNDDSDVHIHDGLIIIDEATMVGMKLFLLLMLHTTGVQLVLVGDINQLPSVEAGSVFRDIIESKRVPGCTLQYRHRQNETSHIPPNASAICKGNLDIQSYDDFQLHFIENSQEIEKTTVSFYKHYSETYGISETICLSPYKKDDAGTFRLNSLIQEAVNPIHEDDDVVIGSFQMRFHVGDSVIHLRNEEIVGNGDIGVITSIANPHGDYTVTVQYSQNRKYVYTPENIDDLMLAYAITVHKSQGSEYECVINCFPRRMYSGLLKRNVLYTGATRASTKYIFLGPKDVFEKAIQDNSIDKRNTLLAYNIQQQFDEKHLVIQLPTNNYQQLSLSV